jgi:hypothetical protein
MKIESCHWCHNTVKEFEGIWFDNYGEEFCKFHPVAHNLKTSQQTGKPYKHETEYEVYEYVRKLYSVSITRSIDDNVVILSSRSKSTSRKAAEKILPRTGSIRREVYNLVQRANIGLTDYELELMLKGKHQTVSASRRSLVVDGFLSDSGMTRKNDVGNDCIVWQITIKETLFG